MNKILGFILLILVGNSYGQFTEPFITNSIPTSTRPMNTQPITNVPPTANPNPAKPTPSFTSVEPRTTYDPSFCIKNYYNLTIPENQCISVDSTTKMISPDTPIPLRINFPCNNKSVDRITVHMKECVSESSRDIIIFDAHINQLDTSYNIIPCTNCAGPIVITGYTIGNNSYNLGTIAVSVLEGTQTPDKPYTNPIDSSAPNKFQNYINYVLPLVIILLTIF